MTTQEEMHGLHKSAVRMLPGFRQAQAQLAVATHVLEYFARFPEYEIAPGRYQPFERADEKLLHEVDLLRSMLNAFGRIHEPRA